MTDMSHNNAGAAVLDQTSWYQHGWVWIVISIPFTAVLFGIVMFVSANYQPDDLVVDDYYKVGKAINQEFAFDRRALEMGAMAVLQNKTTEGVVFNIKEASDQVRLSLFHVTNSEDDIVVDLVAQGSGLYSAHSPVLTERLVGQGVWYLEIRDLKNEWRLRSRLVTPLDSIELTPKAGTQ